MTEQNGVKRSSATNELRRLLDERGVKWGATDTHRLLVTSWNDSSGHSWAFTEHRDGGFSKLTAYHLTPEQAVTATLGAGECFMEYGGDVAESTARVMGVYFCSECGSPNYNDCMPYYCIYCGKAVKR